MTITDRYADPLAALDAINDVVAVQLAHRSVRAFTPEPVSEDRLRALIAAAQSASTSSNLQAWSVIAVQQRERKARLATLAGQQAFIDQAPLLLVWIADLSRARRLAGRAGVAVAGTDYLESTIIGVVDAALAAQNAVVAAESFGLGTVFVGAMRNHPIEVAAELGLPDGAVAVFGLAVGTPDPTEHAAVKPRLPQDAVLHRERYDAATADSHIATYDERLSAYNASYGLTGNWSDRVLARLADAAALNGRDRLRDHFERLGLPSR